MLKHACHRLMPAQPDGAHCNFIEAGQGEPIMGYMCSVQASKAKLQNLAAEEKARREASKQKNELESYIIAFQGRIAEDEDLMAVTSEAQREGFSEALLTAEDWLYSDGESQPASVFM